MCANPNSTLLHGGVMGLGTHAVCEGHKQRVTVSYCCYNLCMLIHPLHTACQAEMCVHPQTLIRYVRMFLTMAYLQLVTREDPLTP